MKIIVPVAGRGRRFYPKSAYLPKCLIPVRGRLMIEWALDSIWHAPEDTIVIYHRTQRPLIVHALRGLLPQANLVEQTEPPEGPAHTVYQARDSWKNDHDVVVVDCDVYSISHYHRKGWPDFSGDGSVLTFRCLCPSKSYIKVRKGYVTTVAEKEVISDLAVGGIYHFRNGDGLHSALRDQLGSAQKIDGEFYLSGAVNNYLRHFPRFLHFPAESFHDLGSPRGVQAFERSKKNT